MKEQAEFTFGIVICMMILQGVASSILGRGRKIQIGVLAILWLFLAIPFGVFLYACYAWHFLALLFPLLLLMGLLYLIWRPIKCMLSREIAWKQGLLFLLLYMLLILYATLFSREGGSDSRIVLEFFGDTTVGVLHYILNILLFVPLGVGCIVSLSETKDRMLSVLTFGILLSAMVEGVQMFFSSGICDVNDLICNSLGVMLGVFLGKVLKKGLQVS